LGEERKGNKDDNEGQEHEGQTTHAGLLFVRAGG
jgi:hypothetical protein